MFVKGLILLAVLIIFSELMERYLRERFSIPKQKGRYRSVNNLQRWVEAILIVSYIILGFLFMGKEYFMHLLISFFLMLSIFRIWFEWKYNKDSKQYILLFNSLVFYGLLVLIIMMMSK